MPNDQYRINKDEQKHRNPQNARLYGTNHCTAAIQPDVVHPDDQTNNECGYRKGCSHKLDQSPTIWEQVVD